MIMDESKLRDLERRVGLLEQTSSRYVGALDKSITNNTVADGIYEVLWNEVFYISSFASASITTTATELLDANGRESDTSAGRRFRPERPCKFKTSFYLDASISKAVVYITAPAISTSSSIGTSIIDANKSFVGIKIAAGNVSMVASRAGTVTTVSTGTSISTNATNVLEISYYPTHATMLFNGTVIGDIPCNLLGITFATFFPFLISVGSKDGTSVNLTTENFEFIQRRK